MAAAIETLLSHFGASSLRRVVTSARRYRQAPEVWVRRAPRRRFQWTTGRGGPGKTRRRGQRRRPEHCALTAGSATTARNAAPPDSVSTVGGAAGAGTAEGPARASTSGSARSAGFAWGPAARGEKAALETKAAEEGRRGRQFAWRPWRQRPESYGSRQRTLTE